jgi:hypothetical protein
VRLLLPIIALLGASSLPACAADTPAQMVVGEDSIEELLQVPKHLDPGRYEIQCEALISDSGAARHAVCYSMTGKMGPDTLHSAVVYAVGASRFLPARHNGQPVQVYAVLMVIVDTRLEEPLILAVPNNGVETAKYGLLYSAPQRYGDVQTRRPRLQLGTPRRSVVWMNLQIDAAGVVQECTLTGESSPPQGWVDSIRAATKHFTFVPGYHDGKPVPMLYVEPMMWAY